MTVASTSTRDGEWVGLAERAGGLFARYGLVIVIAWIGAMKFTQFEAEGIQPLIANSPAMAWLRRYRKPVASIRNRAGWSAPALYILRFDPDRRSATAIRQADPQWADRLSAKALRDGVTHRPIPDSAE